MRPPRGATGSFKLPFQEQIDFFNQKLALPSNHYDDILKSAHDRAFIVAGATKADLLNDLQLAVAKTMSDGKGIYEFRQEFNRIVAKHGWTGWKGEGSAAGVAWRTKVIYQTNLATSYAAGRWAQLNDPDLLKVRPYWKYIHSDSVAHPRPLHQSWNGTVLRHDDPWWATHFPPCGWMCRCRIMAVRAKEFKGHPAPNNGTYNFTSRDGTVHTIPKGIDYGFDYAPGASNSALLKQVIAKQDGASWQLARTNTRALVDSPVFRQWHDKIVTASQKIASHTATDKATLVKSARTSVANGEQFPIAVLDDAGMKLVGAVTKTVVLSDYDLAKQAISREGQGFTAADYLFAQDTIEQAQRILRDKEEYTLFIHRGDAIYVAVLQRTKTGKAVFLKSFRRGNEKDAETQLRKIQRDGGQVLKDEW